MIQSNHFHGKLTEWIKQVPSILFHVAGDGGSHPAAAPELVLLIWSKGIPYLNTCMSNCAVFMFPVGCVVFLINENCDFASPLLSGKKSVRLHVIYLSFG